MEALRRVQGHRNVTGLSGVYEDEEAVHLVMDLCDHGQVLSAAVEHGSLSEAEVRHIFTAVAAAVDHCHLKGMQPATQQATQS